MRDDVAGPDGSELVEGLGPLPPKRVLDRHLPTGIALHGYSADDMRAYAAEQVAAERERCSVLTDDMLRYAMAALGTGSPAEAARFRAFWLHAMTARDTRD